MADGSNAARGGGLVDRAVAKADRRALPLLLAMYVMAFLDRTNVGFAEASFRADTGIGDTAYALGASIFFVGYALLEVPSNILLTRFGARLWLSRIMVTWGLVSALMVLIHSERGFYALRFCLGVAEAGFFPGVIFYLTRFYPARHRGKAMGFFYVGAPLSFILGGPLSGALISLDGLAGVAGWQWLFLLEGVATMGVGVLAYVMLADGPATARWLTGEEKLALQAALDADEGAQEDHRGLLHVLRSWRVLHLGAMFLVIQMAVYGLVFFMPGQIAQMMGRKIGLAVGAMTAVPWAVGLLATLTLPRLASRMGRTHGVAVALMLGAGAGLAGSVLAQGMALKLLSLCLATASFIAVQPLFWAMASQCLPRRHRAAAIALINSLGAVGSFIAPNLRVALEHGFQSPAAGILGLGLVAAMGAGVMWAVPGRPKTIDDIEEG